jgi:Uma2 family endonuclease
VSLYAQAGVTEVWLVDLVGQKVTFYREPGPQGYASVTTAQGDQRVSPQAFPDLALTGADILG